MKKKKEETHKYITVPRKKKKRIQFSESSVHCNEDIRNLIHLNSQKPAEEYFSEIANGIIFRTNMEL